MKLFVPVICYNHTCHTSYMMSMMRLLVLALQKNIDLAFYPITFDSLIPRARNSAVAAFLSDTKATHLMFIDADIEFDANDVFRLLAADKPIVAGAYPQKWLNISKLETIFSRCPLPSIPLELCTNVVVPGIDISNQSDIVTAEYVPTGFLMIQRAVFETLIEKYPERHYANDIDGYTSINPLYFYDFFSVVIHPTTRRLEGEDYHFSRLARESGFDINVMKDIALTHHGSYAYKGNLQRQLEYFS